MRLELHPDSLSHRENVFRQREFEVLVAKAGLDTAQRIHNVECKQAQTVKAQTQAALSRGEPISKIYTPTPHQDYINRIQAASRAGYPPP